MKVYIFLFCLIFIGSIIGGHINGFIKDKQIDNIKMQAVKYGYAHIVPMGNKLEWVWIKPEMQMYYRDDEGNDTIVNEESTFWKK